MINYELNKEIQEKKIENQYSKETFIKMKPKLKARRDFIEVKEINIIHPSLKEKVLKMQFNVAFRRLLKIIMDTSSTNATQGDAKFALTEVSRMKKILMDKYKQEISKEEYENMWKKALYLEHTLQKKINIRNKMLEFFHQNEEREERGRGR